MKQVGGRRSRGRGGDVEGRWRGETERGGGRGIGGGGEGRRKMESGRRRGGRPRRGEGLEIGETERLERGERDEKVGREGIDRERTRGGTERETG